MSDPTEPLRAALDAAKALQSDLDELGVSKPPAREPLWTNERINDVIIEILATSTHTPRGLARRISYAVRDSYEADRSAAAQRGDALEAQLAEAHRHWLPTPPLVEMTPDRITALQLMADIVARYLYASDHVHATQACVAFDTEQAAVTVVRAMLDEVQPK